MAKLQLQLQTEDVVNILGFDKENQVSLEIKEYIFSELFKRHLKVFANEPNIMKKLDEASEYIEKEIIQIYRDAIQKKLNSSVISKSNWNSKIYFSIDDSTRKKITKSIENEVKNIENILKLRMSKYFLEESEKMQSSIEKYVDGYFEKNYDAVIKKKVQERLNKIVNEVTE